MTAIRYSTAKNHSAAASVAENDLCWIMQLWYISRTTSRTVKTIQFKPLVYNHGNRLQQLLFPPHCGAQTSTVSLLLFLSRLPKLSYSLLSQQVIVKIRQIFLNFSSFYTNCWNISIHFVIQFKPIQNPSLSSGSRVRSPSFGAGLSFDHWRYQYSSWQRLRGSLWWYLSFLLFPGFCFRFFVEFDFVWKLNSVLNNGGQLCFKDLFGWHNSGSFRNFCVELWSGF